MLNACDSINYSFEREEIHIFIKYNCNWSTNLHDFFVLLENNGNSLSLCWSSVFIHIFFYLHNSVSKFIILWYCIWLSPKDIGPRNQSVINCRGSWCNSEDSAWDNHIAYWNAYLQVLAACPFPCPTNEYPERKPEMAPVESLSPSGRTGLSCLNQAQASI